MKHRRPRRLLAGCERLEDRRLLAYEILSNPAGPLDAPLQANDRSFSPSLSADGRFAAFMSRASNLVPDDTNGVDDIFVRDRQSSGIVRASASAGGEQGNGRSDSPAISGNGQFVVFASQATNLVPGDTNDSMDVFVKDLHTGAIRLASEAADGTQANGRSFAPAISHDGRFVIFTSAATNLIANDTNNVDDIFRKDLVTGEVVRVSERAGGVQISSATHTGSITADGSLVAFAMSGSGVWVKDLESGELTQVANQSGDREPSISTSGGHVAYRTAQASIFVVNLATSEVLRADSTSNEPTSWEGEAGSPRLSSDGRYVIFQSRQMLAGHWNPAKANDNSNVFLKDLQTGEITRLNNARNGMPGPEAAGQAISADGTFMAYAGGSIYGIANPPNFPTNRSPTFAEPLSPLFFPIEEDNFKSWGTPVWKLVEHMRDADEGDKRGMAVIAVETAKGRWEYTLDDGVTWRPLQPTTSGARLLPADGNASRVRFVPTRDAHGSARIWYRGWDQTTGEAGETAQISDFDFGGWSAFSYHLRNTRIDVAPVNDAPVLPRTLSSPPTLNEDSKNPWGVTIVELTRDVHDVDLPSKPPRALAITMVDSRHGTWQYTVDGGQNWKPLANVRLSSALLLAADGNQVRVRFIPKPDWIGKAEIGYFAWDKTTGESGKRVDLSNPASRGGTTAFSLHWRTVPFTVLNVNDAPRLNVSVVAPLDSIESGNRKSYGTPVWKLLKGITDIDPDPKYGLAITAANNTNGTWQYTVDGGITWRGIAPVSLSQALPLAPDGNLVRLRFVPNPGFAGEARIGYFAWDQTHGKSGERIDLSPVGSVGGTKAFSAHFRTSTIHVTPPNKPPQVIVGSSIGYQLNGPAVRVSSTAGISDDNADFANGYLILSITSGRDAGNRLAIGSGFALSQQGDQTRVLRNGVVIGTLANDGMGTRNLRINFNANAKPWIAQELLRSITFGTVNSTNLAQRVVTISLFDGRAGGASELKSVVVHVRR
jgi:Tol biopolymer transport system component